MGEISLVENDTDDVIYLVPQGQQHIVEEDSGDRDLVILAAVFPHSML